MTSEHPTTADLLKAFHTHAASDEAFQEKTKKDIAGLATKDEVRTIFAEELKSFFRISGLNTKTFIVGLAVIIGALSVIFGGAKALLGALGLTFMK